MNQYWVKVLYHANKKTHVTYGFTNKREAVTFAINAESLGFPVICKKTKRRKELDDVSINSI
jgi:hypothetical protein